MLTVMRVSDDMAVLLSSARMATGDLRVEMFELHNSLVGYSSIVVREEKKHPKTGRYTSCGSCIRRVQTNVLKHYMKYDWDMDGRVEHWNTDKMDRRPLFRWK
jgi:hypothetical protein